MTVIGLQSVEERADVTDNVARARIMRIVKVASATVAALVCSMPTLHASEVAADASPTAAELHVVLDTLRTWVHGRYDNTRQFEHDIDSGVADDLVHRQSFQFITPATVPALDGYVVFQQSSSDGSDEPERIGRLGLLHFFVDEASTSVRLREYRFKQPDRFKNAHRNPQILSTLTLADLNWDEGCDFYLRAEPRVSRIGGPIRTGACRIYSAGLKKQLMAEDFVVITPDQFWYLGRFVDESGRVMWGNRSPEPVQLIRVAPAH